MSGMKNVSVLSATIEGVAEEMASVGIGAIQSIDGGDHQVNIWANAEGVCRIMIQGTGENVTLLSIA